MEMRRKLIGQGLRCVQQIGLLRIWSGLCGQAPIPDIASLLPEQLNRARDTIAFCDVRPAPAGPRYLMRYVGSQLQKAYGSDVTGKFIDEIVPATCRQAHLGGYDHVVTRKEPHFSKLRLKRDDDPDIHYERLLLPFSERGSEVERILIVATIFSKAARFTFHNALQCNRVSQASI